MKIILVALFTYFCKLSIPVYATKLTVGLIQEKLGEAGMLGRVDLKQSIQIQQ